MGPVADPQQATDARAARPDTSHQSQQQQQQQQVTGEVDGERRPKSLAKACAACRARKVRCDTVRPRCGACVSQGRECIYRKEIPRKRPTFSQILELQRGQEALKSFIVRLKQSSPDERERLLASAVDDAGNVHITNSGFRSISDDDGDGYGESHDHDPNRQHAPNLLPPRPAGRRPPARGLETPIVSSDDELDITHFISVDDAGKPSSFGPSSALHNPAKSDTTSSPSRHHSHNNSQNSTNGYNHNAKHESIERNSLIAKAAVQRHLEHNLARLPTIRGVPTDLALHLLNLHWARQHHTFLLTYRPAVMRDLQCGGPYCSDFMLYAIFACSSKFSQAPEVRDNQDDRSTSGRRFFRHCDELLARDGLLTKPHITTIVGLLLLGSTYNARGDTSKGWLYTGYALRMVYDLGLHLDPRHTTDNPEEIEIRRRVFWGAFVCDKLQSLYLGRPVAISLRDSQVSHEFLDLYEETEPFLQPARISAGIGGLTPQAVPSPGLPTGYGDSMPIYSVTTFQQLCLLSKVMTTIINRFYVVGATFSNAQNSLQQVDLALQQWREKLAPELDFQPWLAESQGSTPLRPPNVMILHNLYHSLIILVHRPFILDGHLRSATPPVKSWERCTVAARCITSIALAYRSAYALSGAPYVLAYTIYVACTIHVRNAASQEQPGDHLSLLTSSLACLDELRLVNHGVTKPANIIRRLIEVHNLDLRTEHAAPPPEQMDVSFDFDAILSMFPVNTDAEFGLSNFRFGLDDNLPTDPLFGLMDGPTMTFDLETPGEDLPQL